MTRDETLGLIAAALAVMVSTIMCAACLVGMHAGEARAVQPDEPEAREAAWEPPAEPEPEPCGLAVDQAPEEAWEEPVYCETQYAEPTYVKPAYVEPVYYEPEPTYYEPAPVEGATPAYAPTNGLTKEGGVNYHDGRTETYYSSNVLYHYRTPEWTLDEEGYYHDAEGRYVVAASDMEQGTVFEGSKGECVVLDCGCDAGVTDYYVAW